MRISGGRLRGRQFFPPKGYKARPTTDFAKDGLFNILNNEYEFGDLKVLDLFGGTGAIPLEFDNVTVVHHNVFDFLEICTEKFDLIFADPPYAIDGLAGIPDKIFSHDLLHPGCYFILEHPGDYDFSSHPHFVKERCYGNVHFSFFSADEEA